MSTRSLGRPACVAVPSRMTYDSEDIAEGPEMIRQHQAFRTLRAGELSGMEDGVRLTECRVGPGRGWTTYSTGRFIADETTNHGPGGCIGPTLPDLTHDRDDAQVSARRQAYLVPLRCRIRRGAKALAHPNVLIADCIGCVIVRRAGSGERFDGEGICAGRIVSRPSHQEDTNGWAALALRTN
jgi:hypothetical protein